MTSNVCESLVMSMNVVMNSDLCRGQGFRPSLKSLKFDSGVKDFTIHIHRGSYRILCLGGGGGGGCKLAALRLNLVGFGLVASGIPTQHLYTPLK